MLNLALSEIATITAGRLLGADTRINGVAVDTRKLEDLLRQAGARA